MRGRDEEGLKPGAKKAKTAAIKKEEQPAVVAGGQLLVDIHTPEDNLDIGPYRNMYLESVSFLSLSIQNGLC